VELGAMILLEISSGNELACGGGVNSFPMDNFSKEGGSGVVSSWRGLWIDNYKRRVSKLLC
jgi:hypothetical protein